MFSGGPIMILVTGATGNVGRELVDMLVDKGAPVRILVRDERKAAGLDPRVERVVGDLDIPESLPLAMHGIESLYIVTPVTSQVTHLIQAARKAGIERVVKQSTIEADRSLGPGKWHREQEKLIEDSGVTWTFLRPTMMMVNTIQWWADTIRSHSSVYFPGGRGKVSPVDARDVAATACAVLTQPGHKGAVYELTGPEVLSIADMVQILGCTLGRPVRYTSMPVFIAAIWMRRSGMSKELARGLVETLGALHRNEYAYTTDAIEWVTGRKPRSYAEWCADHLDDFR
jgi:uncharacterized protein YbjT (DUF2867 family)